MAGSVGIKYRITILEGSSAPTEEATMASIQAEPVAELIGRCRHHGGGHGGRGAGRADDRDDARLDAGGHDLCEALRGLCGLVAWAISSS